MICTKCSNGGTQNEHNIGVLDKYISYFRTQSRGHDQGTTALAYFWFAIGQ